MKHKTTINALAEYTGLFSIVDHITVSETHPDTEITEEISLPPPLIRRTQHRDGTPVWVLTPPGIHERIFVADQAIVTVYLKEVDPSRFTSHVPPTPNPQPTQAAWQPTAPQRAAAPWVHHQPPA
ncbi:hypothetical protein LRE75_34255 [Streptomyces sp. 372A]